MRKILSLLLVFSMSAMLIGCQDTKKQQDAAEAAKKAAEEGKVAVEKAADAAKEAAAKVKDAGERAVDDTKKAAADAIDAVKDAVPK